MKKLWRDFWRAWRFVRAGEPLLWHQYDARQYVFLMPDAPARDPLDLDALDRLNQKAIRWQGILHLGETMAAEELLKEIQVFLATYDEVSDYHYHDRKLAAAIRRLRDAVKS